MVDQPERREDSTTPQSFAATTPPASQTGHDFTLQAVMEMQKSLGALGSQIESLDKRMQEMSADLSKHGKWIFAANVVLVIAVATFGWIITAVWDIVKAKFGI